jgi:carbamoyl-phosphate synthase small subunit
VKNNRVEISSQNHGFTVIPETLGNRIEKTHVNLNDNTLEGLIVPELKAFSVQYHPEAAPGPQDANYLFTEFTDLMLREKRNDA